jgi:DNA polymerase III delta prime subunit
MNDAPANDPNDDPDYDQTSTTDQPKKARKKRTRKSEDVKEKKDGSLHMRNQASLERFTRPLQAQHGDPFLTGDAAGTTTLEEDLNQDRKKRRKTVSPEPADPSITTTPSLDWHHQLQVEAQGTPPENTLCPPTEQPNQGTEAPLQTAAPAPIVIDTEPLASGGDAGTAEDKVDNVTPKKQIRITKSGKLVSSPPKPAAEEVLVPRKRRGRKPAHSKVSPTVTIIKYGSDDASRHAIGAKIDAILGSKKSTTKRSTTTKKGPPKPAAPPKSTHPFFTGKAAQKTEDVPTKPNTNQQLPTPRKSAVTPGKLWAEAHRDRPSGPMPTFGTSSASNRVTKQSGLFEASWPTRGTAHVRNLETDAAHHMEFEVPQSLPLRARKLKNRVITLKDDEEVISRLAKDLAADMRIDDDQDKFDFKPPEDVRLPNRLLTTGVEIQRRVNEHLQMRSPRPGEQPQNCNSTHPAVTSLFTDIEHTLTPFDEGRCESQTWAQKYGPKCATHVLHNGNDAMVLKDWLQSLTVMAVGGTQGPTKTDVTDVKRPPKKKRKKVVNDFIISDGEEEDEEMVEIDDVKTMGAKSFRRPRWTRNNNVILISGPHGCGKSATVYAVAKELDFEVFEINSGTRRSGKDIQDRVGDMTANHLVNHKRTEAHVKEEVVSANDNDNECMDTACQKDIDSGRQGTMMSFFKSKPTTQAKAKPQPRPQETHLPPTTAAQTILPTLNPSSNSQKQSLILFEEADILFEEDQQFWAQVMKLAAHSKRPIVITCNDERQIPSQGLPLAAALRLQSPPVDLATDYMLVLAGREGHILERQAVSDLYESKNHDLRASITELDFWCQMSVGDKKGGLEWLYQRWPPGKDVDESGRLLRVASDGTYQSGMGWLSHNVFETRSNTAFDKEEELLSEVWSDWGISPADWETTSAQRPCSTQDNSLASLERLDALAETISAADMFCRVGLPSYESDYDQPADPTLPPLFDKARLSYTLDARLLQADRQSDFLQFDTCISTYTHLLACRAFPEAYSSISASTVHKPISECDYAKAILRSKATRANQVKLSRTHYSYALDTLAAPPDTYLFERTSFNLTPSSFDRTFAIITLDLAPYVRSIVAHEQILESQRIRLSNLLSAGGNGKRARTTRASRVALEGGVRETKRRDRWFDDNLNFELVMATAGKEWAGMGWRNEEESGDGEGSVTGTQESLAGSQDFVMQGVLAGSQDVEMQGAHEMT